MLSSCGGLTISRFIRTLIISVFLGIFLSIPGTAQGQLPVAGNDAYFNSVMDFIQDKFKGEVNDGELHRAAINGMFDGLDDYTDFLSPREAEFFQSEVNGGYIGIGVELFKLNDQIMITGVFNPSPAQSAGIMINDVIVKIDGINTIEVTLEEASALISGEETTQIALDILRPSNPNTVMHFELQRAAIDINPVHFELHNDIGYIKIDTFNTNSAPAFYQALKYMNNNDISKIILDLRGNPGGEVGQAVAVAQQVLPAGLVARLNYKSASFEDMDYYSYVDNNNYELVVLVDEMSASASEIVAGAIQDTGAGILVGSTTYGKSKVQQLLPILTPAAFEKYSKQLQVNIVDAYDLITNHNIMPADNEIIGWAKISTGEYFTPLGRSIDGVGLTPDVVIEKNTATDLQFQYLSSIGKLSLSTPLELNMQGIDVYYAEVILDLLGYQIKFPDMILEAETIKAIRDYQSRHGLEISGMLDLPTQKALNDEIYLLTLRHDRAYARAVELLK